MRRALDALLELGYRPMLPVDPQGFADPDQRRAWIQERNLQVFSMTIDAHHGMTVDVFASEPFDFESEYRDAMAAEIGPDLVVPFLRLAALIEMKEATGRARDIDDAEHLREIRDLLRDDEPTPT